jgi:hypothetical protein
VFAYGIRMIDPDPGTMKLKLSKIYTFKFQITLFKSKTVYCSYLSRICKIYLKKEPR